MKQFNYPTTIYFGDGSLKAMAESMAKRGLKSCLLVTDKTLAGLGMADQVTDLLKAQGLNVSVFDETHPNPIEEDVIRGAEVYLSHKCDSLVALGGGSPMDAAKGIMIQATQKPPLAQYDDAIGGDKLIKEPLPPLFAVPTTAGTGSEVGRAGVIIIKETNNKTILFHPKLLPTIAVLEPSLTEGLPPFVTAATGMDAFTHCLEAFLAPGFDPMADGLAIEGMRLVVRDLPECVENGKNLEARGRMQMAAAMGAIAFQKGLGMIHSMAHPLSSECGLHHGLANALLIPASLRYLLNAKLNKDQQDRLDRVQNIFADVGLAKATVADSVEEFATSLGIKMGLAHHGVEKSQLEVVAKKAVGDVCHKTNMIPVTEQCFLTVLNEAYES